MFQGHNEERPHLGRLRLDVPREDIPVSRSRNDPTVEEDAPVPLADLLVQFKPAFQMALHSFIRGGLTVLEGIGVSPDAVTSLVPLG